MKLNVAIIGAGLAGLALGQSLKNSKINFTIYERDQALDSRPQGYRIRIDQEGQNALKACLSEELYTLFVNTCSQSNNEVKLFDQWMNGIGQPNVDAWDITDQISRDLRPNRNTLREILCKGIEEHIVFGKNLKECNTLKNKEVQLIFEDGETRTTQVVVFADGVNSSAGSRLFRDEKINTQHICVYGKACLTDRVLTSIHRELQDGTAVISAKQMSLIVDCMKFNTNTTIFTDHQLTLVDNYLYWSLVGSCQAFGLLPQVHYALTQKEIHQLVLEKVSNWDTSITALLEHTASETLSLMAIRTSNVQRDWQQDSITVMGDAIHAMTPAGGMGANIAFKDAVTLSNCLQEVYTENISIADALAHYKKQMLTYSSKAILLSTAGGDFLYGS